jgi:GGDEF domain-containing protein
MIITILVLFFLVIVVQVVYITRLERGGFDAMSRAAGTVRLTLLSAFHVPCAVVVLDIRGMHELNAVIGYMVANKVIAHVIRVHDMRCQFGGDEIVIFIPFAKPGTAKMIASRIIERCKQFTITMEHEKRKELHMRTAGKIDGLHVAIISVDNTSNALITTHKALNELETIKENGATITGNRATTGNPGTLQKHYERF